MQGQGLKSIVPAVHERNLADGCMPQDRPVGVHPLMGAPYGGDERRHPELSTGRPLFIADLDGTITDASHREHFVNTPGATPDWRGFFAACANDLPVHPVITTIQVLKAAGAEIRIWTGRSDEVMETTKEWLYIHRVPYHQMVMRPAGDHSSDVSLKASWWAALPSADKARVVAVLEDRQRVVDMWRRLGVPCFQVAPGMF